VLLEVNAETDFVARNEEFKSFVKDASQLALRHGGDLEKLLASPMGGSSVQQTLTEMVAKIGREYVGAPRRRPIGEPRRGRRLCA